MTVLYFWPVFRYPLAEACFSPHGTGRFAFFLKGKLGAAVLVVWRHSLVALVKLQRHTVTIFFVLQRHDELQKNAASLTQFTSDPSEMKCNICINFDAGRWLIKNTLMDWWDSNPKQWWVKWPLCHNTCDLGDLQYFNFVSIPELPKMRRTFHEQDVALRNVAAVIAVIQRRRQPERSVVELEQSFGLISGLRLEFLPQDLR